MEQNLKKYREDRFWNAVFIVAFVLFAWAGYVCLDRRSLLPSEIGVFDFFVLMLAIFRIIRLVCYDAILSFFRDWFQGETVVQFIEGEERKIVFETSRRAWKRTVSTLLGCPWCTGIWVALFSVFIFFAYPGLWVFFLILALSGLASFFQVLATRIGRVC